MRSGKWTAILFWSAAVFAQGQTPLDSTTPRIAVNQEAKDVETKLELMQQELYAAQQQIMFLSLREFADRMTYRRVLFPSGKELVPAYIFTPRSLDSGRQYPGLVIVHGAFHGRLDWRFFDLIEQPNDVAPFNAPDLLIGQL